MMFQRHLAAGQRHTSNAFFQRFLNMLAGRFRLHAGDLAVDGLHGFINGFRFLCGDGFRKPVKAFPQRFRWQGIDFL